jgi:hypothetical protein
MDEFRRSSPWRSSCFPSRYVSLSISDIIGDITHDGVGVSATSHLMGWERKGDGERARGRELEKTLMIDVPPEQ